MIIRNVKAFLSAIALACRVADSKATMPALSQVRLQASEGVCKVVSTDLDTTLISEVSVDTETPTDTAVNAKALVTVLKKLDSAVPIEVGVESDKLLLRSGPRQLRLDTFPVTDLPVTPAPTSRGIYMDKPTLARSLGFVESMASTEDYMPHLCVVHLEYNDATMRMVSTDGHRLAVASVTGTRGGTEDGTVELPARAARIMLEVCKASNGAAPDCRLGYHDTRSTFTCGPHTVIAKNADTTFPPYEHVIPRFHDFVVRTDAAALYAAMDLVRSMAEKGNYGAEVGFKPGFMVLSAMYPEMGQISEEVIVSYDTGKEDLAFKTGFNTNYFLDALKNRTGAITVGLGREMDPGVVRFVDDPDTFCLIMPMRP